VVAQSKKSVVRSIRIPKELDELIRQSAEDSGVTMNGLISSILSRYSEWDRYVEQFGFVTLPRDGFRTLIEGLQEEKLVEIADAFGPPAARDISLVWFKEVNLETFLRYLSMQSRDGGFGAFEVDKSAKADTVSLNHNLGARFSLLFSRFLEQTLPAIAKISPRISVETNVLAIHFPPGTLADFQVA
jgi:hypothetical protein